MAPVPAAKASEEMQGPPAVSIILGILLVIVVSCVVLYTRRISHLKSTIRTGTRPSLRRQGDPIEQKVLDTFPIVKYKCCPADSRDTIVRKKVTTTPIHDEELGREERSIAASCEDNYVLIRREDSIVVEWFKNLFTGKRGGPESCAICADDFADGTNVRKLPCKHIFHPPCIDHWLLERAGTCPLW